MTLNDSLGIVDFSAGEWAAIFLVLLLWAFVIAMIVEGLANIPRKRR